MVTKKGEKSLGGSDVRDPDNSGLQKKGMIVSDAFEKLKTRRQ